MFGCGTVTSRSAVTVENGFDIPTFDILPALEGEDSNAGTGRAIDVPATVRRQKRRGSLYGCRRHGSVTPLRNGIVAFVVRADPNRTARCCPLCVTSFATIGGLVPCIPAVNAQTYSSNIVRNPDGYTDHPGDVSDWYLG